MKHFSVTPFAGIVFLLSALASGAFPVFSKIVSPETSAGERYQETVAVKQGVSQDGTLFITRTSRAPSVPPGVKALNHERTLRAFTAPDRGGVLALYVESVRPHEYYTLAGSFVLSSDYPVLAWESATTLAFYATTPAGELLKYSADVHLRTLSASVVDPATAPTERALSGDILP
jgi:hypothetical protein